MILAARMRHPRASGALSRIRPGALKFPGIISASARRSTSCTTPRPAKCGRDGDHDPQSKLEPCRRNQTGGGSGTKSLATLSFWSSIPTWRRAGVNTLRCLAGCTTGDFAAMWFLQSYFPSLGIGSIMAISMVSGVTTSMLLETVLLHVGRDGLPWMAAARTAAGMSLISMLTMEAAENSVDYHLTGGTVALDSPAFWAAAAVSMTAGFLAPLPYNYVRLRKYGKACH